MASSQYTFQTPPRSTAVNRLHNTPTQQLGGRDADGHINQELPPELRQAASAGFGGGGFGQARQQDQYIQQGYQIPIVPGANAVSGSLIQAHQYHPRSQGPRGSRASTITGQQAGRISGGAVDPQVQPVASTEGLAPIPRAARTVNENLMAESRYPDLDTIVSRKLWHVSLNGTYSIIDIAM